MDRSTQKIIDGFSLANHVATHHDSTNSSKFSLPNFPTVVSVSVKIE